VLRAQGKLVFSFIELAEPLHWKIVEDTVNQERRRHCRISMSLSSECSSGARSFVIRPRLL
jgi:hypothetical protein